MKNILVIEDEPLLRSNLLTILEMEGFKVTVAENGKRGMESARRQAPDLIICDVMMPVMDGYTVLENLRSDRATASVPFIFLTAKSDRADLRTGMTLGADDYLTKPFTVDELLAAIDSRFRRAQQLRSKFKPAFHSLAPLERLGLTRREAEVLLWVAQGKSNSEIGVILKLSIGTVKKHMEHIFAKLGTENRAAATLQAIEVLNSCPESA